MQTKGQERIFQLYDGLIQLIYLLICSFKAKKREREATQTFVCK